MICIIILQRQWCSTEKKNDLQNIMQDLCISSRLQFSKLVFKDHFHLAILYFFFYVFR